MVPARSEGATWEDPVPAHRLAVHRLSSHLDLLCSHDIVVGPTSQNALVEARLDVADVAWVHGDRLAVLGAITAGRAVLLPDQPAMRGWDADEPGVFEVVLEPW